MEKIIGIVGGVGPYAGLDLNRKIFDNTLTTGRDQDHLEVYLLSRPADIEDRTRYLRGETERDPVDGIVETIVKLVLAGAQVVGIPCNTAHAPLINDRIRSRLGAQDLQVEVLHIVEECHRHCRAELAGVKTFGLLSTIGTYQSGIYPSLFERDGERRILSPCEKGRLLIHDAIYNVNHGIKARSHPVSETARGALIEQALSLIRRGAQGLILGCSEIPLALEQSMFEVPVVDANETLARALVNTAAPHKLKPLAPVAGVEIEKAAYLSE